MKKLGGIFILTWMLFRLVWHTFTFDDSPVIDNLYFIMNDLAYLGFALLIYSNKRISFMSLKSSKRIYRILITYTLWCLIVDCLIILGIGAHDTAIYTQIDIAVLSIGALWAIYA